MPMRKFMTMALAALGLAFGALLSGQAQAAPISGGNLAQHTVSKMVQKTQYYYGGHGYCWYADAWRGPGYYWCGYAWRRGYGWGGGYGWRGWGPGGPGPRYYGGVYGRGYGVRRFR